MAAVGCASVGPLNLFASQHSTATTLGSIRLRRMRLMRLMHPDYARALQDVVENPATRLDAYRFHITKDVAQGNGTRFYQ